MTSNSRHDLNFRDPTVRNMVICDYDQRGIRYTRDTYGINGSTVRRWKKLRIYTGSLSPQFRKCGKSACLSKTEIRKIERALLRDPFLTNQELADVVKNKVTARAVGNYINKSKCNFVWKLEQLDAEATFTQQHKEQGEEFIRKVRNIPLANRIYVDESFCTAGVVRRKGRYPSGTQAHTPRNTRYPRKTTITAIRLSKLVHPTVFYNKGSITTEDFEEYAKNYLCPELAEGDVVFWDRLGRSGRAKNPVALHYSPKVKQLIEARGARVMFLPPYGKLLSPVEMVIGDVKHMLAKKIRHETRFKNASSLHFEKLKAFWLEQ